jgi:alkyldihydroxyacetonephosphate synthase
VSRRECVFWGWGEPGAGPTLPDHAAGFLRAELGVDGAVVSQPVALEEVRLSEPALGDAARARLADIVGEGQVRSDAAARVGRCRGKSYLDLLRQRAGECEDAPDAVVAPGTAEEVQAVLYACNEEGVAVVPFGGGTSVVGGLEPLRGRYDALVSLDLGRLEGIEAFDERSHLAWLRGGTRLPEADHALAQRGFTLGHTPQSYEWATVGGCVATRSAGQTSTGHGRIEENVVALRCATPSGELANLPVPATAAGPSLKQLVIGS